MTCRRLSLLIFTTLILSLLHTAQLVHALDPRFELDPRALQQKLPNRDGKTSPPRKASEASRSRQLRTGMKAVIPAKSKSIRHGAGPFRHGNTPRPKRAGKGVAGHGFTLFRSAPEPASEGIENTRTIWQQLVPAKQVTGGTISIRGKNYSLDLAPDRFPLFPAADGGKILIEAGERLSPIVKSLIQDHDPGVRFVAYTPDNRRRFFTNLLAAAGFYSVEENFTVSFGIDPKLTVTSDFKVENSSDSPLQHDIFLMNVERYQRRFPTLLSDYLAKQGFRVIDLYPGEREERPLANKRFQVITDGDPSSLADTLLSALDLDFETDKEIELLSMREGGVALSVKADRYFEKNGEKFVVSVFRGDLENYTLLRLLESQRYHVIVLTPEESLRSIAGKFISQLHLHGRYAMQELLGSGDLPYSIQMSGLMVENIGKRGMGRIFMTTARPDPIIGELLELNGYAIHNGSEKITHR